MTVQDIFARINNHMVEGVMFHDSLSELFGFLGLKGYQAEHECHALGEYEKRRELIDCYISYYNKILPEIHAEKREAAPSGWVNYERIAVDEGTKKRAVRDAIKKWHEWERETVELYAESYRELVDLGELYMASRVEELACDAAHEMKRASERLLMLETVSYDIMTICGEQDEIHEKYKKH